MSDKYGPLPTDYDTLEAQLILRRAECSEKDAEIVRLSCVECDLRLELGALRAERDEAVRKVAALRELMNCYNLGGWTDAERLQGERDEAVALLRDETVGEPYWCERRDSFLAKVEAKP